MKKENDMIPIPKGVLQLTRWRWWALVGSTLSLFGTIVRLQMHTAESGFLEAPWMRVFGCVGTCVFTAMIWYVHFYWKRHSA